MPALLLDPRGSRHEGCRCCAHVQAIRRGFTCCVLACPDVQPSALFSKVLPLLAPSACFAIFSNYLQPLAECMHQLQVPLLPLLRRIEGHQGLAGNTPFQHV